MDISIFQMQNVTSTKGMIPLLCVISEKLSYRFHCLSWYTDRRRRPAPLFYALHKRHTGILAFFFTIHINIIASKSRSMPSVIYNQTHGELLTNIDLAKTCSSYLIMKEIQPTIHCYLNKGSHSDATHSAT